MPASPLFDDPDDFDDSTSTQPQPDNAAAVTAAMDVMRPGFTKAFREVAKDSIPKFLAEVGQTWHAGESNQDRMVAATPIFGEAGHQLLDEMLQPPTQ